MIKQRWVGVLVVWTACSPAGGSLPTVTVADSAGVTIVESRAPAWATADRWTVSAEPSVSIGVLDGDPEYQLYGVRAAVRRSDGGLLVVDESRSVRHYDASGRFVATYGGAGDGPGEFSEPRHLLLEPDDGFVVWDAKNFRRTAFSPEGDFLGATTLDLSALMSAVEPPLYPESGRPLSGGRSLVRLAEKADASDRSGVFRPEIGALVVEPDGSIARLTTFAGDESTSLAPPFASVAVQPAAAKRTQLVVDAGGETFCVGEQSTLDAEAAAGGEQATAEFTCYDGEAARSVRWRTTLAPLTEADVDDWMSERVEEYAQKMSPDEARKLLDGVASPSLRPAYGRMLIDRTGHTWVETARDEDREDVRFSVFEPTGRLLGEVQVPGIEILDIGTDYVLGVHVDELGVEYLRVHPLSRPSG